MVQNLSRFIEIKQAQWSSSPMVVVPLEFGLFLRRSSAIFSMTPIGFSSMAMLTRFLYWLKVQAFSGKVGVYGV